MRRQTRLVAVAVAVFCASLFAACDAPEPRQSSEAFLARREMASSVVEIAEEALADDDPAKAAAAYGLLIDLWPDLPEAQTGGAWSSARARAERLPDYGRQLESQRRKGLALQTRLRETGRVLDAMHAELDKVVEPEGSRAAPSALYISSELGRSALVGAMQGRR